MKDNSNIQEQFNLLGENIQELIERIVEKKVHAFIEDYKEYTKRYFHIKEVSELTNISISGLKQRIKRGTLKAAHNDDGQIIVIPKDELDRLLNSYDIQCK